MRQSITPPGIAGNFIPALRKMQPTPYLCRMASELSLGDAIRQFLNKSRIKGGLQALQITQVWEQLMGKTIAKYTDRIEINGTVLYIYTTVAPLKQELQFQKENIIKRVNEAMGEAVVNEVVIR
jgi:predicted nucleic acid-binding Zn ribbon protein